MAPWSQAERARFDGAKPSDYVGAYVNEGLGSEVLLRLAEELKAGLPSALAGHRLAHLWAYSYGGSGVGISLHADFAAVNVNLWLTPDEANLAPERWTRPHHGRKLRVVVGNNIATKT